MSGPVFEWKLREMMAMRGMFSTFSLIEPLADRGISLSRSQVCTIPKSFYQRSPGG